MNAFAKPPAVPRVAIVTGGTRGIGFGIAQALAMRQWSLAVCGMRGEDEVRPALDALRRHGAPDVLYVPCDVASRDDRARLVEAAVARFGALDALVNNAGRAPRVRADLLEASEESFEELIRTNLQGPYFLTQQVAPLLAASTGRHASRPSAVVFVTSVSAEMASTNRGDYCVSKAGLAMAVKLFAARLARDRVSVYEVRPGIIHTDMTAGVASAYDARIRDGLVPEQRWGMPTDVGAAVEALLEGHVPYATGSVVHVDGGLSIPRL